VVDLVRGRFITLAEWVLLVRGHLPRLPLLHQPERLAAAASSSWLKGNSGLQLFYEELDSGD